LIFCDIISAYFKIANITKLRSRYTHKITTKGLIVLNGNIENKASIEKRDYN